MSPEKVSAATKEARKKLFDQIKDDWAFDAARQLAAQVPESPVVRDHSIQIDGRPCEARDITPPPDFVGIASEWRERSYATSEASSDEERANKAGKPRTARPAAKEKPPRKTKRPSPASTTDDSPKQPDAAALARKRRRRGRLNEELSWNTGLAHWTAQRDAWCCARNLHDLDFVPAPPARPSVVQAQSSSSSSQPASSSSPSDEPKHDANPSTPPTSVSSPVSSPTTSDAAPDPPATVAGEDSIPNAAATITIVPVSAPLLPATDPTRSSITPAIYPSIYTKVVVQSLAPSVPINLSDLIPALVQGWKRDGEWPPRSAPAAPVPAPSTGGGDTMASLFGMVSRTRHRELLARSGNGSGAEKKSGLFHVLDGSGSRLGRKSKKLLHRKSLSTGANEKADAQKEKDAQGGEDVDEGDGANGRSSGERKGVARRVGAALRRSLNGSLSGSGNSEG